MAFYVPGTEETDPKKQNMSLQLLGAAASTNTTNIATNTTNIAANTAAITALQSPGNGLANSSGSLGVSLAKITASLGADVALNNTANFFDGPSVAQGTTGTWFVSGTVTLVDTAGAAQFQCKLWDGTTVISSSAASSAGANFFASVSLSGYLASPAANIRISVKDISSVSGKISFNQSGTLKDSTLSAYRIA
jgi:hypothetical protein